MAITLNQNTVFGSLVNMIISTQVFDTGVDVNDSLYQSRKVDGTLYGDTKRFISTDILKSYAWNHGNIGYNLLTQHRPTDPIETTIVIDQFRQIPLSTDDYLSKQAFADEGSFAEFTSVFMNWLQKTKQVYEHTKYLADMLTSARANATKLQTIDLSAPDDIAGRDLLIWQAQEMFRQLEDAIKELGEPTRAFNDNGFLRTAKMGDFDIVAPLGLLSNISKHDVPFLFNEDGKPLVKEVHWKYFGAIIGTAKTAEGTERSLIETDYTVSTVVTHVLPGDLIPVGAAIGGNVAYTPKYSARPTLEDGVEMLLIHKRDYPIMSAFSVGTSFFNPQSLVTNSYLTFGHNEVYDAHIGEFPLLYVDLDITAPAE